MQVGMEAVQLFGLPLQLAFAYKSKLGLCAHSRSTYNLLTLPDVIGHINMCKGPPFTPSFSPQGELPAGLCRQETNSHCPAKLTVIKEEVNEIRQIEQNQI